VGEVHDKAAGALFQTTSIPELGSTFAHWVGARNSSVAAMVWPASHPLGTNISHSWWNSPPVPVDDGKEIEEVKIRCCC